MGMYYSNIHIKKNGKCNTNSVRDFIVAELKKKGFEATKKADNCVTVALLQPDDSDWITVSSELYQFNDYDGAKQLADVFSKKMETDVITAFCSDSDWAFIGLFNSKQEEDGWINVGLDYEGKFKHELSVEPWKRVVSDEKKLSEMVQKNRGQAEEAFIELASIIKMKPAQTKFMAADANDQNTVLYFKSKGNIKRNPVCLKNYQFDASPCVLDTTTSRYVYNTGEQAKGIGILFSGDYIQNDDIVIKNACFISNGGDYKKREVKPIELKKVICTDGKYGLYWENKNFVIPHGVDPTLSQLKQTGIIYRKMFGIQFIPSGNRRKVLDIKITFIPLANSKGGQDSWYAYRGHKTKAEYIAAHNEEWKSFYKAMDCDNRYYLNPENYDL